MHYGQEEMWDGSDSTVLTTARVLECSCGYAEVVQVSSSEASPWPWGF
jgi:hypothetical protein